MIANVAPSPFTEYQRNREVFLFFIIALGINMLLKCKGGFSSVKPRAALCLNELLKVSEAAFVGKCMSVIYGI